MSFVNASLHPHQTQERYLIDSTVTSVLESKGLTFSCVSPHVLLGYKWYKCVIEDARMPVVVDVS